MPLCMHPGKRAVQCLCIDFAQRLGGIGSKVGGVYFTALMWVLLAVNLVQDYFIQSFV